MQRPIWRLGAALAIAIGIVAACGGEGPSPGTDDELFLTAAPRQINDKGQTSQISVSATKADGTKGTGTVTLKATAGSFTSTGTAEETLTLANGAATTTFLCNRSVDAKCVGNVRIDGTWGTVTGSTSLTVSGSSTGTDGGPDGGFADPSSATSLVYVAGTAKTLLGLASSGRETTSPVAFKASNASNQPVANLAVSFQVSGVGGATVTPSAVTNAQGVATATLQAGDNVGVAIVKATVTGSAPEVSGSHPGTPIVGGKPSDSGLQVDCVNKAPLVLISNPPPAVTTDCTAKLVDRFSNPVGLATAVQWYTEAGSINSPVESKAQTGFTPAADTGLAKTIFNSSGSFPPYAVTPMPGEKHLVDAVDPANPNPRDMAVTLIAVVAGEEQFVDGSGSGPTAGQTNGRWDPGEWFTDLGEPLVDRNDNGVWDPGESFIDTERIDCANPNTAPTKNNRWDGPNGCWDSNTQLWRAIHLVYTGPIATSIVTGPLPAGGVWVPINGTVDVPFYFADAYLNRLSTVSSFTLTKAGTPQRGFAALQPGTQSTSIYGGFAINYKTVEGTTQSDGGFVLGPPCDTGKPTPPNSSTSPVATRCVRTAEFTFPNFNSGVVRLTGETTPQEGGVLRPDGGVELPDGGPMPPITNSINVKSGAAQVNFNANYQ